MYTHQSRPRSRWAQLLPILGLLLVCVKTSAAQSERVLVADVLVEGNRAVPFQTIMNHLKTRPGREYNPATVEEDIRRLYTLGSLSKVNVRNPENTADGHVIVTFTVEEYPNLIREVIFKNAPNLKVEEIQVLRHIRKGAPLNIATNNRAVNEIQEFYKLTGRQFTSVKLEEGGDPTDTRVVFNVTEGSIVRVRSISFTGDEILAKSARMLTKPHNNKAFFSFGYRQCLYPTNGRK